MLMLSLICPIYLKLVIKKKREISDARMVGYPRLSNENILILLNLPSPPLPERLIYLWPFIGQHMRTYYTKSYL